MNRIYLPFCRKALPSKTSTDIDFVIDPDIVIPVTTPISFPCLPKSIRHYPATEIKRLE